jgi:ABC-2 type transport system ATP-binding protein
VLAGVDLDVAPGDLVAVVGENGTGKTTLLRILAGDLRPDAGIVATGGRPGYCPQTVVLDEALIVDQHVRYFQAAYGIGSLARAHELIERLDFADCYGQRAGTLSGGTKQKLSLTLALMHDPAVLLLDEPYQGFDWQTYLAFWDLGAATYAAFGLLIGVLVRGDLEGFFFFLIIMISMLDTFLENPVDNPLANKPILEFFPSYAPTQFATAGAFHHQVLGSMAALSLAWTAAFALLGLAVLRLRLPAHRPHQARSAGAGTRQIPQAAP